MVVEWLIYRHCDKQGTVNDLDGFPDMPWTHSYFFLGYWTKSNEIIQKCREIIYQPQNLRNRDKWEGGGNREISEFTTFFVQK